MNTRTNETRQSIWSVRPALVGIYFGLFTLAMTVGTTLIVLHEITVVTSDTPYETWIVIMQGVALLGLTSGIVTFTITEIMENAMVMANWLRQQYLEPLKERQREEGRDDERERLRTELLKRGIKLTKEDEDALFKPNGHSR